MEILDGFEVRPLHAGMGQAVAERTILRKKDDGSIETWGDVAARVAKGNASLISDPILAANEEKILRKHISKGIVLMSGRHLQHGDADQYKRNLELFSNCSTSPLDWLTFLLLLNGSGVGRCFDDDFIITNWDNSPNLRLVIDQGHPDFDWSADESVRDAHHKYVGDNVIWHEVGDSREGWAKAIEVWELLTYQKVYKDHTLVLDFSKVRPKGAPIKGMQGRPSSGPKPLMDALRKCASIKGAGMKPWLQAMYMDHYMAECVLVGGARRAARMATKTWRDPGVIDFIRIKRPIEYNGLSMDEVINKRKEFSKRKQTPPFPFLWSSNNSVAVDEEFWERVKEAREHINSGKPIKRLSKETRWAWKVLEAITEAAYGDGTGEPGIINVHKLKQNDTGWNDIEIGDYVGSQKYQVEDDSRFMLSKIAKIARNKKYHMICNPCGEVSLAITGGYCIIADNVPFHADTFEEIEEGLRVSTRALIRVNLMNCLYSQETKRTNRIGVGLTGVHEFAWKFFKVGFKDLVNPDFDSMTYDLVNENPRIRAANFWKCLEWMSNVVREEAETYSKFLGINVPHTSLTIKPSGCVTPDTKVRTSLGVKTIEEIFTDNGYTLDELTPGQWYDVNFPLSVFDLNDDQQKITKLFCNGIFPTFELIMEDGSIEHFTGNHEVLTTDGWMRVDQLNGNEDIVFINKPSGTGSTTLGREELSNDL